MNSIWLILLDNMIKISLLMNYKSEIILPESIAPEFLRIFSKTQN
jgi:hypothetical protein